MSKIRCYSRSRRETTFAVGAALSVYGLVLSAAWCARTAYEHKQHVATSVSEQAAATMADDYRRKSEPICRLFNAPGNPSEWSAYTKDAYEGGRVRRTVWAVDCTGHELDAEGRFQGAFVLWEASSGALYMMSNAAAKMVRDSPSSSPESTVAEVTRDGAIHAAREWLERLRLQDTRDPWQLSGTPSSTVQSWQVRWRRHQQVCQMNISRESGDLILMKMQSPRSEGASAPVRRPPAG
jgi:hypothetical protein